MKKVILAATAALAAALVAPAANASVSISCPQISGSASCSFSEGNGTGFYGNSVNGAFDDTYYITLTDLYKLSITLTNTVNVGGPITFGLHQLLNSVPSSLGDIAGGAVANNFIVGPGTYALHFTGNSTSSASYSGTIDVAAVPEPASWAMMIAGIAAVGTAMRRRSQLARVAFS
ncbi:MAG: PEP-CTERM sorting domain-containing protein [Sphingobium sp.]|nr:PEP-CTERM sorting domain-containing protein [Sphingobium sp.]